MIINTIRWTLYHIGEIEILRYGDDFKRSSGQNGKKCVEHFLHHLKVFDWHSVIQVVAVPQVKL